MKIGQKLQNKVKVHIAVLFPYFQFFKISGSLSLKCHIQGIFVALCKFIS